MNTAADLTANGSRRSNSQWYPHHNSQWEPSTQQPMVADQPLTLPEGEEDDRLDGEELENRVIRGQELLGRKVEQEEGVEGKGHRDVVNDCDVEIAAVAPAMKTHRTYRVWLVGNGKLVLKYNLNLILEHSLDQLHNTT